MNSNSFINGLNSWLQVLVGSNSVTRNLYVSCGVLLSENSLSGDRVSVLHSSGLSDELRNGSEVLSQLSWLSDDQLFDRHLNVLSDDFWFGCDSLSEDLWCSCDSFSDDSWLIGNILHVSLILFLESLLIPIGLINIPVGVISIDFFLERR